VTSIFVTSILKMGVVAYVLASFAALFAIYVVGSLVPQIRGFGVKRRQSGQSPKEEEYVRAIGRVGAEQVRQAVEDWTVPRGRPKGRNCWEGLSPKTTKPGWLARQFYCGTGSFGLF
jgi:uncharacterized protein (DUF58 family)